ncbi:hypothetical protein [Flavobacterium sp. RS13.1]|uniref:hypothetical protein n=1 Tax=Flavobacterium sp. RS13.1 TaxID=3400345 RepID=UPI003AAD9131
MRLLYATLSFLFFSIIYGQQQSSNYVNLPVTPEAAALAKMVNYPVNHNTGVPNINIPFYEIKVGNLKLPITLNYHAGGFKINEKSTRTGLGWSLSCDLQITQSINGLNDLHPGGYIVNNLLKSYIPSYYPYTPNESYFYGSDAVAMDRAYNLANGDFDGMPDKFNYQLLEKTGSFYFQKNDSGTGYSIITVPYSNIKITYESGGVFKIIDTDGTIYYFGTSGLGDVTYLNLRKKELTKDYVTSWKCDRVISNNKVDEIIFNYINKTDVTYQSFDDKIEFYNNPSPFIGLGRDPYYGSMESPINNIVYYDNLMATVPFHQISSPKYKVYHWNKSVLHVPYLASSSNQNLTDKTYLKNESNSSFSVVKGISISEINFRGGKVVFNGADKLNSIEVLDDKNNEIKSLSLFQSATTTSSQIVDKTNYLDSLHVRNSGNTFERYVLFYNNKFNYGNHLKGHDVFGYPNESTSVYSNNTNNDDLSMPKKNILMTQFFLPEYDNTNVYATNKNVSIGGNSNWNETPNEEAIKKGILRQIIYPTGGSVNFDFETNKYQEEMHTNLLNYSQKLPLLGGGLRIRSINYLDANSTSPSKQVYFRYGDLEEGTGLLISRPQLTTDPDSYYYGIENYEQIISYLQNISGRYFSNCDTSSCMVSFTKETKTTYSSASSLNYTYPNGAPIYYTKVTEYEQDLGKQTGKTVHTYYKPDEFYSTDYPFINRNLVQETNIPYLKTDWMMGQQKSKEIYKYDPKSGFKSVYKKSFEYIKYLRPQGLRVVYSFFKYFYQLQSTYTGSTRDLYNLDYPNNFIKGEYALPMGVMLLSKEKEDWFENTGTKSISTSYFYDKLPFVEPSRILTQNSKGESIETSHKYAYDFDGVYDEMENANMISPLIEEITRNITKNKELSRKKTNFEKIPAGLNFFAPKTVQSSVKGGVLETDTTIDQYDQFGNVLQLRGRDEIPVSYLWGYHDIYPVAELKNVSYAGIPSTYKSNIEISDPVNDTSLINFLKGLRNTFNEPGQAINTYTYKRQVGVTSITDTKDLTQYFDYDSIGRLKNIKDNNLKIVKSINYNIKNFKIINFNNYYNIPMMRSIDYNCETGLFNNYIIPGGKYNQASSESSNNNALNILNNLGNNGANFNNDCLPNLPYASLELASSLYNLNQPDNLRNYPNKIEVDFIQEGSIVATQKINITDPFTNSVITKIFLPHGTYQLSFRIDPTAKYQQGYLPDISVTTVENNNKQYLFTGGSFTFEQQKHYKIYVANFPR